MGRSEVMHQKSRMVISIQSGNLLQPRETSPAGHEKEPRFRLALRGLHFAELEKGLNQVSFSCCYSHLWRASHKKFSLIISDYAQDN